MATALPAVVTRVAFGLRAGVRTVANAVVDAHALCVAAIDNSRHVVVVAAGVATSASRWAGDAVRRERAGPTPQIPKRGQQGAVVAVYLIARRRTRG